ncbi:MAG TPA: hypothetical protein VGG51_03205 [Candidatus Cybelea sp.]|jgi:hypothetical protein
MLAALFENEPQASAAATVLRELGFDSEVILRGANTFEERTRDFFAGKPPSFEPHALLLSANADDERFARTVQRHYGILIENAG